MITAKGVGFLPTKKIIGVNRTGGTLTVGGVYAVDVTGGATESTDADSNLTSIVEPATGNVRGFLVVADQATLDDQPGTFTMVGRVPVLVETTTTDCAEGDSLIPVNGQIYLIVQTKGATGGIADTYVVGCAIALAASTTNAATLTDVFFDGYALFKCDTST